MIFRSKSAELIAALNSECEVLRAELQSERSKRVAAEKVAEERLIQLRAADERALRFEQAYTNANAMRLASLDTVNGVLLRGMAPEAPQTKDAEGKPEGQQVDISPKPRQSQLQKAAAKHIEAALAKIKTAAAASKTVQ